MDNPRNPVQIVLSSVKLDLAMLLGRPMALKTCAATFCTYKQDVVEAEINKFYKAAGG